MQIPPGSGQAQCIRAFRTAQYTDRQTDGHTDRKTENNAGNCIRIEWEGGYYLGKKVRAQREEDSQVRVRADRENLEAGGKAGIWAGEQEDRQADR